MRGSLSLGNGSLTRTGSCGSLKMLDYIDVAVTDDDRGPTLFDFETGGKRGSNLFVSLKLIRFLLVKRSFTY